MPTILTLEHQPLVDMLPWQPVKDVVCLPAEDDMRIYCMGVNERARGISVEEKIQQCEVISSTLSKPGKSSYIKVSWLKSVQTSN